MDTHRIVVVEDDPGISRLVSNTVAAAGCEAFGFPDGAGALAWLAENHADLLLLDNILPDMHALEFLDKLEQLGKPVPFIITTGQGNEAIAVELMKRGAVDYVVKDVDFLDNLPAAIGRALNVVKTHRRLQDVEAALSQYRVETEAILEAAMEGIFTFDRSGVVVTANSALRRMFQLSPDSLEGLTIEELFPEFEAAKAAGKTSTSAIREQLNTPREFIASRRDGSRFEAEITFSEVEGSMRRLYLGVIRDISEKKRVERQLLHDAFHDKLTGLPNRALTINRISHALNRRTEDAEYRCAVIFVDLDRFKQINDTMGHAAGDILLTEVARRLAAVVRPADTLARISGDEFAIVLEDVSELRSAVVVAERVIEALELEVPLRGTNIKVNASIGISLCGEEPVDAEELLRRADIAMYRAKENGRGRYEIFDIEMHSRTVMMLRTETDLRRAIGTDEIIVYYQPIMELATMQVAGFEALVRWQHPKKGMVSPADFIPIAEDSGLIVPLGRQVLVEACRQTIEWHRRLNLRPTISVNVSAHQLQRDDVVGLLRDTFESTGLEPKYLKLELTEGVFIEYQKGKRHTLDEIKAMGVGLAIDDFGTGYSSFGYLGKLPIQTLKLDRSFIRGLPEQADHIAISSAILAMSRALSLDVVAEGVELEGQQNFLREHGCRFAQGFLFSRPLPAAEAEKLLTGAAAART